MGDPLKRLCAVIRTRGPGWDASRCDLLRDKQSAPWTLRIGSLGG